MSLVILFGPDYVVRHEESGRQGGLVLSLEPVDPESEAWTSAIATPIWIDIGTNHTSLVQRLGLRRGKPVIFVRWIVAVPTNLWSKSDIAWRVVVSDPSATISQMRAPNGWPNTALVLQPDDPYLDPVGQEVAVTDGVATIDPQVITTPGADTDIYLFDLVVEASDVLATTGFDHGTPVHTNRFYWQAGHGANQVFSQMKSADPDLAEVLAFHDVNTAMFWPEVQRLPAGSFADSGAVHVTVCYTCEPVTAYGEPVQNSPDEYEWDLELRGSDSVIWTSKVPLWTDVSKFRWQLVTGVALASFLLLARNVWTWFSQAWVAERSTGGEPTRRRRARRP